MFDHNSTRPETTAWLAYNASGTLPPPRPFSEFPPFDDTYLIPLRHHDWYHPDQLITLDVGFQAAPSGINYAIVNNSTYMTPRIPSLWRALTSGHAANDPKTYGLSSNPYVVDYGAMVWIVINNDDTGPHPCISRLYVADGSPSPRAYLPSHESQCSGRWPL